MMEPAFPENEAGARLKAGHRRSEKYGNLYLAVSAVLQVALIITVAYLLIQVSSVANGNRANAVTACQDANANRTEDTTLFKELLALPPGATAAQRTAAARDLALVHKAYALRDCVALYGAGG